MYTQSHELYGLDYATRLGFLDYDPKNNNVCVCFAAISHVYQADRRRHLVQLYTKRNPLCGVGVATSTGC